MNRLIRFYNQNRERFWLIVFIVILVITIPRMLNEYVKNNRTKNENSVLNITNSYNKVNNKPSISGNSVSQETTNESVNIIDQFFNYCNSNNIEAAYNMLSDDCKEQLFPQIEDFENRYYNKIFNEKRLYSVKTWISNNNSITYRVEMTEDMLSSGRSSELNIVDYYTVVDEDNTKKLNINNYIGKEIINAEKSVKGINFKILERDIYAEYEIYKIKVFNNTKNKIMIDSKEKIRSVNIKDQREQQYVAFLNEIGKLDLTVYPGETKEIEIKFNKAYNPKYIDKYLEFDDIVINTNDNAERASIEIEI